MNATAQKFQCKQCTHLHDGYAARCVQCGAWDSYVSALEQSGPALARPLNSYCGENSLKLATGIPQLDAALSGGFVPGLPVILCGEYGLGKSTLALQAAFWIGVRAKRQSLYVSGEEAGAQVLERCKRLGLTAEWIYFLNPADVAGIRRYLITGARPPLIVIDSLQCLDDSTGKGRDDSRQWRAYKQLLALGKAAKSAQLILSQVNRTKRVRGGPRYGHEADAVMYLRGKEGTNEREIYTDKNRNGRGKFGVTMQMTAEGLK